MSDRSRRLELLVLRHADAGDPAAWEGADADRPLSGKGNRQAARVARWLRALDRRPDAIVTSPKVRASETAVPVAEAFGLRPIVDDRLAGDLGIEELEALLADAGDPARVVIVGHDPDLSELVATLSGIGSIELRKGSLARIDLERPIVPGRGTLRWLVPPDALPD